MGIFQRLAGKKHLQMEFDKKITVRELINRLTMSFSDRFSQNLVDPQIGDPRPNTLILVGGREISTLHGLETEINDTEEIVLVPIIHGG